MTLKRRVRQRTNIQLVILGISILLALVMGIAGSSQARAVPAGQGEPPVETPTQEATLAATETLTPTETATPNETATETATPIPPETVAPAETATETPIPTETATETPIPVETPTETAMPVETATETAIPTQPAPETPTPTSESVSTLAVTLRGYWKLDESSGQRADSISQNHLKDGNGVSSQPGLAGGAADFEQSSQYLSINDTEQSGLEPLNNGLTLVGWLKPESVELEQIIAAKYDYGLNDRGYRLDLRPGNKIGFLTSANGRLQNDYKLEVVAPEPLTPGVWYHLAAVFDAQQKSMSLYLNGNLIGSRAVPGGVIYDSAAPFMLGANLNNRVPMQFFDGLLDEWRVYSGALTQGELQILRDTTLATPTPIPTDTPTPIPTDTPTVTSTPTQPPAPTPSQTLQGYWKLDEIAGQRLDSSPFARHLTNHNTVASLPGKLGLAADFEKNQQEYFSFADTAQNGLDPLGNGFSLVGWFNPESLNNYQIIAAKYEYGSNGRAYRLYLLGNNKVGLLVSPDGTVQDSYRLELTLPAALAPGAWHHLAGIFDAQQQSLSLYLDGQLLGSQPVPFNTVYDTNAPFTLGANMNNGSPTQFFDGLLDEWQFYTGALSQAEIQALINNVAPTATPTPINTLTPTPLPTDTPAAPTGTATQPPMPTPALTLQGYWKLDEIAGQRLDSSPFARHLTNHNTVGSLPGKAGLAADLEKGQQEYFSIADGPQSGFDPLGSGFSLVGWFRPESLNNYQIIAAKYEYGSNGRAYRLYLLDNNKIGLVVSPDGALQDAYRLELTLPAALAPGAWHHLAGIFDAQQRSLSLYLDGQLLGSQPVPFNTVYDTTAPFTLGANMNNGAPTQYFDGLLDEWRFYSGVLSQAEIQSLMNSVAPTPTSTPINPPTNTPTPTPTRTPTGQPVPVGCNPSGGSGGLQVGTHSTTVAGLTAIVVVGKGYNPQTPTYLGFNLHGDGGLYTMVERSNNPLNELANERGWILVSPLAPNGNSWWSNPVGDHKQALANAFDEMFARYNLCRKTVFGTTGSGGSAFWTAQFFPDKGGQYPAHTVIGCGGNGGNSQKLNALGNNPDIVARSTFYYVYGTEDNLVPGILQSIQAYSNAGFDVRVNEIEGAGHCNRWRDQNLPTWHDWAATYWEEMANELGVD